ncbi:hypothetical protein SLS57_010276 [Botryosphaeria dothidea]
MAKAGSHTSTYGKLVFAFIAIGSLTYGYAASIISSTIGLPGWYLYFDLPQSDEPGYDSKTTPVISTANGLFSAGGAVATLIVMWSCDAFGRIRNIQMGCLLGLLGGALQGGATSIGKSPDDPNDLAAKEEMFQIKEQLRMDANKLSAYGGSPWKAVVQKKSYRKRMIIGFLTQWGAEFGGPLIINNYAVILYTNLGQTGYMPLLLSALWLTTAGVIYNPLGAWLHDKVNSRRTMYMIGFAGIIVTTSILAAMTAEYAGTTNRAGNAIGVLMMFLYLAMQGTFCDTTMYLYVSEIFPTEIRSIGMGWSLFGQFSSTIILLQTAPLGFANAGWKYYLVIICWSAFFLPCIYFFWPETARLTLEEIGKNFGDEVAVHITDATDEEKARLDRALEGADVTKETGIVISSDAQGHSESVSEQGS